MIARLAARLEALLQMGFLRQLALPEVAGQHRVAVTIHAIDEVLISHAEAAPVHP